MSQREVFSKLQPITSPWSHMRSLDYNYPPEDDIQLDRAFVQNIGETCVRTYRPPWLAMHSAT
jgi:hypothetical protein